MDANYHKRVAECVYDITSVACHVIFADPNYPNHDLIDSRELFHTIYEWAQEFERENPDPVDYMLEIELFAYKKLRESGLMTEGGDDDDDCV